VGTDYVDIMALLQKLKSLLGFDGADSERGRSREVGVTVEREAADDGPETATAQDRTEDVRAEPPQSATAGTADDAPEQPTDVDTATEPAVDSETAAEAESADDTDTDLEGDAEPAVDAESEQVEPELDDETEPEPEPEPAVEPESEPDVEPEPEVKAEPVTEIKGIGPAYADRLAGAGVETVAELAASDAAELADQTDISEKRIQGWIDRAEVR